MSAWLGVVSRAHVQRGVAGGFVPFRRRVRYAPAREVPLEAVKDRLELCRGSSWGVALRRGLLPLAPTDLATLTTAMG